MILFLLSHLSLSFPVFGVFYCATHCTLVRFPLFRFPAFKSDHHRWLLSHSNCSVIFRWMAVFSYDLPGGLVHICRNLKKGPRETNPSYITTIRAQREGRILWGVFREIFHSAMDSVAHSMSLSQAEDLRIWMFGCWIWKCKQDHPLTLVFRCCSVKENFWASADRVNFY